VVVVVSRGSTSCGRGYNPVGGFRGWGVPLRDHTKRHLIRGWGGSMNGAYLTKQQSKGGGYTGLNQPHVPSKVTYTGALLPEQSLSTGDREMGVIVRHY